jgi:uncharacterized membrane protein
MTLTDAGESRIRGYLFVLGRSLKTFLPADVADDAVREVESHIRERIEQIEVGEGGERRAEAGAPGQPAKADERPAEAGAPGQPRKADERLEQVEGSERPRRPAEAAVRGQAAKADERVAVERVLAELGPPLRVAQAYSHEMTLDEAVTTGRFLPMARALWHLATTSIFGFVWGLLVFIGWTTGISFLATAVIKVIFPNNVGIFTLNGEFHSAGATFGLPPGIEAHPFGYWVVPVALVIGLAILVGTQRASRRILGWIRSRKAPARLRLRVEVKEEQ